PIDPAELDRDPRQRGCGLGGKPGAGAAGADPVADLEPAGRDTRMEPRAAHDLRLVRREQPVDRVLAEIELTPEAAQKLDRLLERRATLGPRHPGPQMFEARVD